MSTLAYTEEVMRFFFILLRTPVAFLQMSSIPICHVDAFPLPGCGQMLQYETSSRFVDDRCTYEEFHGSFLKIDGGKSGAALSNRASFQFPFPGKVGDVICKRRKSLDHRYGGSKLLREGKHDSVEKTPVSILKSGLRRLVPSVSFNEKILNGPPTMGHPASRKKSTAFRLSFKRTSCDGDGNAEQR